MKSVILKDKKNILSLIWRSMRWHLNYFTAKRPAPLACNLYITNRCNFRCTFCNIRRKPQPATLPLAKARDIIDDLSRLGCFYFSITGGEPLLVEHLFELLAYAGKSRIKYIHLVTNGYLLDTGKAAALEKTAVNEISISIDGVESVHDQNRQRAGAYSRAIAAIENLQSRAPRIRIVLNAIFMPQDPLQCLHTVELARRFGIYAKVQPLNQHPLFGADAYKVEKTKELPAAEIKETIRKLQDEECVVNSRAFLGNIYNFFFRKEDLIFRNSPCLFGYHHIEITEDGRIFPCLEGLNWQNGLDSDAGLKRLLRSKEYSRLLHGLKDCQGCRRNYYICYYEPRITFPINNFLKSGRT